jgi:hypothetical protein
MTMAGIAENGTAQSPSKVSVLYIGGAGRSGSTVLDLMLGELPGFFAAGEIKYIWDRGVLRNQLCGCGANFHDCPFWTAVGEEAFGGWNAVDAADISALELTVDRHACVPIMATPWMWPGYRARLERYADTLDRLYAAIQHVSGAKIIVDSTKRPSSAFLLRQLRNIDLRFVHLVRDSRGVAFSWRKRIVRPEIVEGVEYMPSYDPVRGGARWLASNSLFHVLGLLGVPGIRLRYESLVRRPAEELERVVRHALGESNGVDLGFLEESAVELTTNHTVAGNPVRLRGNKLALKADDEWKAKMDPRERALVMLVTWPLLLRYGYLRNGNGNGNGHRNGRGVHAAHGTPEADRLPPAHETADRE